MTDQNKTPDRPVGESSGEALSRVSPHTTDRDLARLREIERKFNAVVQTSDYGYLEADLEGRIIHINERGLEILGYARDEVVGCHLTQFIVEADVLRATATLELASTDKTLGPRKYCVRTKDGNVRTLGVNSVRLEGGEQPTRLLYLMLDLTERLEIQNALKKSRSQLKRLLTHMPDVVLMIDKSGSIHYLNHAPPETDADAITGTDGLQFIAPEYHDVSRTAPRRAMETGEPVAYEIKDIFGRWWYCRAISVDPNEELAMVIATDVTGLKVAEDAAQSAAAELSMLFDNIPDFVIVVDGEGKIQFTNQPAPGSSSERLKGSFGDDFIAPEHQDACRAALEKAVRDGAPQSVECRDVFEHWWDCRLVPLAAETVPLDRVMIILTDVTDRRIAEESLRKSEIRYKALFESTSEAAFILGTDGFLDFNNAALKLLGLETRDQLLGKHPGDFSPPRQPSGADSREMVEKNNAQALRDGSARFEWLTCRADGTEFLADVLMAGIEVDEQKLLLVVVRDITKRKRAEEAIRDSERRYRLVAENVTDFVWTGRIHRLSDAIESALSGKSDFNPLAVIDRWEWTFVSPSIERVLGYTVEEGMQLKVQDLITPSSLAMVIEQIMGQLSSLGSGSAVTRPDTLELEYITKNGETVWCEMTAHFLRDDQRRIYGAEGVTRDITERKNFERDLSEIRAQQRQEIAQQLHDQLGQDLLGLRLISESLRKTLVSKGTAEAEIANELAKAAEQAQNRVRQIIKGVRPVEIDSTGLMAALTELATRTVRLAKIRCYFVCDSPVHVDDSHIATELYMIAEEAVRNSIKHASAGKIEIGLSGNDARLTVWVRDDGVGLDALNDQTAGMGVRIMRHRATVIGASLTISPAPERGTRVTCELPLHQG